MRRTHREEDAMSKSTSLCLGCGEFKPLSLFYSLPDHFDRHEHDRQDMCGECVTEIKGLIKLVEKRNGGKLQRTSYLVLFRDFVLGGLS